MSVTPPSSSTGCRALLTSPRQREQTKATRYIQQLDSARCRGDWVAVPELVRKVRKHAPERSCLALTAESEHQIATSHASQSPTKSTSSTACANLVGPLLQSVEIEGHFPEDEFQAQVCIAWIYWVMGDHAAAAGRLPGNIGYEFSQLSGAGKSSANWTRICAIKASYIKGAALFKKGATAEALEAFESSMPIMSGVPQNALNDAEMQTWTELLLTQFCILSSHRLRSQNSPSSESEILAPFRAWSRFWDRSAGAATAPAGGFLLQAEVPRRHVWKAYYTTLSIILQQDVVHQSGSVATNYAETRTRIQQRTELQGAEASYENLLLKEISFPRADQASEEVEEWANLVVQNWKTFCGSGWQEEELGSGGRETVSRNVLEILYRAATKTFHSTAILRHLFTVHLAIADFDLAFKAFDTYLEIVKKGKARVEKTGEVEQGLDDDQAVVQTVSECIKALCQFGSHREAEKARELAHYFKDWVLKHHPDNAVPKTSNGTIKTNGDAVSSSSEPLSPKSRSLIWGAIGIAESQWARQTFDAAARSEIQLEAIKCLGRSLSREYGRSKDVDTLFALALVFAERREIGSALEVTKSALLPPSSNVKYEPSRYGGRFARERSLIPLWHLLALLLSARQEFDTAARACEGAFEQFGDPSNLFGEMDGESGYRSEHLNQAGPEKNPEKPSLSSRGVVDEMDDFEKEAVLEVKMTQLALLEVIEGPEVAVNASDELLSLYSRLFGGVSPKTSAQTFKAAQQAPPQSSSGTLRSLKGSIFGRKSGRSSSRPPVSGQIEKVALQSASQTSPTGITRAPTIHVTNPNAHAGEKQHSQSEKLQKRSTSLPRPQSKKGGAQIRSASGTRSRNVSGAADVTNTAPAPLMPSTYNNPLTSPEYPDQWANSTRVSQIGIATSLDSPVNYQAPNEERPAAGTQYSPDARAAPTYTDPVLSQPGTSVTEDVRLPSTPSGSAAAATPVTRFSKAEQKRRRITLLVKVWLLVAGFYRRAEMYEDAKGAIDEAGNLVQGLDDECMNDVSGLVHVDVASWGQKKSIAELWGDVFSERGYLSVANAFPYNAITEYETALTHFADHPSAIVGLSNLLLDVYSEALPPLPPIPVLRAPGTTPSSSTSNLNTSPFASSPATSPSSSPGHLTPTIQDGPIGLLSTTKAPRKTTTSPSSSHHHPNTSSILDLKPPYLATSATLLDRLAARDRAYGLLSGLTKLGTGWNYSEAWYALARAYEEGGQIDKARDVLWWCIDLEDAKAVRNWNVVGGGGYVL